jgi:hypothetical protein
METFLRTILEVKIFTNAMKFRSAARKAIKEEIIIAKTRSIEQGLTTLAS